MMIVVGCPGMSHSGEAFSRGWPAERIEKWSRGIVAEVPPGPFDPIDPKRNLIVWKRDKFTT